MLRSVFFIAGELSADRYAARLLEALRKRLPSLHAEAIGGPHLRAAGVPLLRESSDWGAIGVAEALKRVPTIWRGQQALKRHLRQSPPDLLIPLDFGAFNVPTANFARTLGISVCYVIPPGSWRPDGGRVSPALASCADSFLTPFPASERKLHEAGLDAHFFGHPLLDFVPNLASREGIRDRLGLMPGRSTVALLPGSRRQELRNLAPAMLEALQRMSESSEIQGVVPLARSLSLAEFESLLSRYGWNRTSSKPGTHEDSPENAPLIYDGPTRLIVAPGRVLDVLAAADAGMICSGTATLEAALAGCPMVIAYRGGGLTVLEYFLRKSIVPEHIGLPNILAERRLCPELIQEECTPQRLAEETAPLLASSAARTQQLEGFAGLRGTLGEAGVFERWADFIVGRWASDSPPIQAFVEQENGA